MRNGISGFFLLLSILNMSANIWAATTSGYILDGGGKGVGGVAVSLLGKGGWGSQTGSGTFDVNETVYSNNQGYYIRDWGANAGFSSGTITPNSTGYAFNPASTNITNGGNFTATSRIRGSIKGINNMGVAGVNVALSGTPSKSTTTDANGMYEFLGLTTGTGSYSVTPSKTGCTFVPPQKTYSPLGTFQDNQDFIGGYYIKGKINGINNRALSGVNVTLSGDGNYTVTTGGGGDYEIDNLAPGNYSLTPAKTGCVFSPAIIQISLSGSQSSEDFIGGYFIKGQIKDKNNSSIGGVNVALSGDGSGAYATGNDGNYEIDYLAPGNYSLTPAKAGCTFSPVAISFAPLSSSQNNQDFIGGYYYIIGQIKDKNNSPISGVSVTLSGNGYDTKTTGIDGKYGFYALAPGNYSVTPAKAGCGFSPAAISFSSLSSSQGGQDFTGSYYIKGQIRDKSNAALSGVTLTLSGATADFRTTVTDGNYQFTGLAAGQYTVVPTKQGYTFNPTGINYAALDTNQENQDFVGGMLSPTVTPTVIPSRNYFMIHHNQINPNRGEHAQINWAQPQPGPVTITIFNLLGDKVITLLDGQTYPEGQYNAVNWDGRNRYGAVCGSGIYIVLIKIQGHEQYGKIAIVK